MLLSSENFFSPIYYNTKDAPRRSAFRMRMRKD
jgi:hypothetical protein